MELSKVTAITLPEGKVSQITDSSGNVLWRCARLPSAYQEVEYLILNGSQGIIYQESILDSDEIIYKFSISDYVSSYHCGTYMKTSGAVSTHITARLSGSGKNIIMYEAGGNYVGPQLALNKIYTLSISRDFTTAINKAVLTSNDEVLWDISKQVTHAQPEPAALYPFGVGCNGYLALNGNSFGSGACMNGKLYSHQHISSGVIVRDFVPCYRKADSKPGMYDLISKTFFTNDGNDDFSVGANV